MIEAHFIKAEKMYDFFSVDFEDFEVFLRFRWS